MRLSRILLIITALATGGTIGWLYWSFNPADSGFPFPQCPSRFFTGLSCPGCGSQRAFHALLHGDFAATFRFNALFLPGILMVVLLFAASALKNRYPKLYDSLNSVPSMLTVLAVIVGWWVIRNILNI